MRFGELLAGVAQGVRDVFEPLRRDIHHAIEHGFDVGARDRDRIADVVKNLRTSSFHSG